MKINNIKIINHGWISCQSSFYTVDDVIPEKEYSFNVGVNSLTGEIDSGIFGISYLLSMYEKIDKKTLFMPFEAEVNGEKMPLAELCKYACYMDEKYPLFSTKKSVRKLVEQGIKKTGQNKTVEEIRDTFCLDKDRFERPLHQVGNEIFRCMAAIGIAHGKEIFCFPWLSKMRFDNYHQNMTWCLDKLSYLEKIVISPKGE